MFPSLLFPLLLSCLLSSCLSCLLIHSNHHSPAYTHVAVDVGGTIQRVKHKWQPLHFLSLFHSIVCLVHVHIFQICPSSLLVCLSVALVHIQITHLRTPTLQSMLEEPSRGSNTMA